MAIKKTEEEIRKIVNDFGYKIIQQFIDNKSKRMVSIMDSDGYKYCVRLTSFRYSKYFKIVYKTNPFSLENISTWIKKERKPFILCENNFYENNSKKLFFQCLREECQEVFDISWDSIYQGQGCPYCAGKRVGSKNNFFYICPDASKEWDYEKNEKTPSEYTYGSRSKVWWACSLCRHNWKAEIGKRYFGEGCPKCNKSNGVKIIYNILSKTNISFKIEFPIIDRRNKLKLFFDFYIADYNLAIEYDGEQHFFPVDFAGKGKDWANIEFEKTKNRDKEKNKYCKDNNIKLLRIPYWEFDNIENILEQTLSNFG